MATKIPSHFMTALAKLTFIRRAVLDTLGLLTTSDAPQHKSEVP